MWESHFVVVYIKERKNYVVSLVPIVYLYILIILLVAKYTVSIYIHVESGKKKIFIVKGRCNTDHATHV